LFQHLNNYRGKSLTKATDILIAKDHSCSALFTFYLRYFSHFCAKSFNAVAYIVNWLNFFHRITHMKVKMNKFYII